MFNFKPKTSAPTVPDEYIDRLDAIHQHLQELAYQNSEIKRTMTRIETKLSRLAIAAGYGDAITRQG